MAKKSKAQIKRLIKRAEARGEVYQPPPADEASSSSPSAKAPRTSTENNEKDRARLSIARKLEKELARIEQNTEMKAKERRSAKRKAEAIASEAAGCTATALMEWYAAEKKNREDVSEKDTNKMSKKSSTKAKDQQATKSRKNPNPYIAFVGQLSFKSTPSSLLQHIKSNLGDEFDVSDETVKIRLLTDAKTGKSRGMAFVEVDNPELLYALLRLHQTFLEGRRINVERTAGGKASSENKKRKLESFQKEQTEYFNEVVDNMLQEYFRNGSIQPDELDAGVVALFKRHSATIVQAALERYVESSGAQKDNPSAYMACLVGKMAEEGIFEKDEKKTGKGAKASQRSRSVLEDEGVDMQESRPNDTKDLSRIFPSFSRGRGRGRKL